LHQIRKRDGTWASNQKVTPPAAQCRAPGGEKQARSYVLGLQVREVGQKLICAHAFGRHLKLDGTPKAAPLAAWT
jgi:hypothetical protein